VLHCYIEQNECFKFAWYITWVVISSSIWAMLCTNHRLSKLFWYCCGCRKVIYESCRHNVRILWRGGRKICSCVCARGIRRVCASRLFSPNGGNHSVERTYRTQYSSNFAHLLDEMMGTKHRINQVTKTVECRDVGKFWKIHKYFLQVPRKRLLPRAEDVWLTDFRSLFSPNMLSKSNWYWRFQWNCGQNTYQRLNLNRTLA